MKNKKLLTIILAISCVLSCFTFSTAVSATDDLSENLVVWYDFEGETLDDKLSDKAHKEGMGSTVADNLSIGSSAESFTFDNGTVTLNTNNSGDKITAKNSADINALYGNSTHYLRFKVPSGNENHSYCIASTWVSSGSRHSYVYYNPSNKQFSVGMGYEGSQKNGYNATASNLDVDKYVDLVITYSYSYDGDTPSATNMMVYISQGGAWSVLLNKTINGKMNTVGDYSLFSTLFADTKGYNVTIDDVKIYNTAMSSSEIVDVFGGVFSPVIHYDFKGENIEEALKDKAKVGSVADDLSAVISRDNFSFDLTNGTVTLNTPAGGDGNGTGEGLVAKNSSDIQALDNSSTNFVRFKLPSDASGNYVIFSTMVSSGSRHSTLSYNTANSQFTLRAGTSSSNKNNYTAAYTVDTSEYVNVAVTYKKTGSSVNIIVYVSQGEDCVWTKLIDKTIENANSAGNYELFKDYFVNGSNLVPAGLIIDDVRVYDVTLGLDELSYIVSKEIDVTISDNDVVNEPALHGAQFRNLKSSSFDIRFVAKMKSTDYVKAGIKFNLESWSGSESDKNNIKNTGNFDMIVNTVYKYLNYTYNGKTYQYYAGDDSYFLAVAITDIPLTENVDYISGTVTPYAVDADGKEYYGTTYTIVIEDGKTISFTPYN